MTTINFEKANAYGITVEDFKNLEKSTFKNVYIKASKCICDIVKPSKNNGKDENSRFFYDVEENNNIIAFTGDRGSGKTTAMLSFVNFMREDSKREKFIEQIKKWSKKEENKEYEGCDLSKYKFVSLPVIDPSKLLDGESLLGLVVARIYEAVKQIAKDKLKEDCHSQPLRNAVEKCEETYKAIRVKYQSFKESLQQNPDDLEHLSELANTSQLRKGMQELIESYLLLWAIAEDKDNLVGIGKGRLSKYFLIIPVDDLDANIEKGYIIAEEIRCFFMLPSVIIPIALKIEQLSDLVEQKFMLDFGKMLGKKNVLDAQPAEMAVKYIQKLIPMQRRIMLPIVEFSSLNDIKIITKKVEGKQIVGYFLELVWKTTGILLTSNQYGHPLIPLNLRAMHQMIDLLEGLPEIWEAEKDNSLTEEQFEKLYNNLDRFEEWVMDSVSSNAVPRGMANILRRVAAHPSVGMNSYLVKQLMQYGIDEDIRSIDKEGGIHFSGLFGRDETALRILQSDVNPDNISIGDIFYLLAKMMQSDSSEGIRHFIAAVKVLYSIKATRLLYTYDKGDSEHKVVLKPNYGELQWLLGGLICNPAVKLSPTGNEWIANSDLSTAKIKIAEKSYYFKDIIKNKTGEQKEEDKLQDKEMTIKQAKWVSFFIVAYGRVKRRDLHMFTEGSYTFSTTSFGTIRDDSECFISAHWMAFVTSVLTIDKTIKRLHGIFEEIEIYKKVEEAENAKEFIDKIRDWQKEYHVPLPINSMDVIDLILENMHINRYQMDNGDDIGKMREYFTVMKSLKKELKGALDKTYLLSDDTVNREKIINALEKCPLVRDKCENCEIVGSYVKDTENKRCFDWLIND